MPKEEPASPTQRSFWPLGLLGILGLFACQWSKCNATQQPGDTQEPPEHHPLDVQPIWLKPIITEYRQTETNRQADADRQYSVQSSLRWATWFAFGAAVIYGAITYCMFRAMQQQIRIQRETGINSERAWVGLDVPITLDGIATNSNGVGIAGHYSIKNFGHGPAIKVVQAGDFVSYPTSPKTTATEAKFLCDSAIKFATGTVPVGGAMKQPPPFGYTLFPGSWHEEAITYQGGVNSLKFLQFIGCVAYIDQFHAVHWTRFCMQRKPSDTGTLPKLEFCSLYNDTDDSSQ